MDLVFRIANGVALLSWIALLLAPLAPRWQPTVWRATGLAVPLLLAIAYGVLLALFWGEAPEGGFGSLAEVQALFAVPGLLVAGWLHYLAFDLFVGTWIARDAREQGMPQGVVVPCLILTFLVGPLGLLLYLALRAIRGRAQAIEAS